jgi:hypothetical protein
MPKGVDMKQAIFVGVDVSKKQLDVAIRPLGQVFGVNNDSRGIAQLVKRLKKLQPVCIAALRLQEELKRYSDRMRQEGKFSSPRKRNP